MKENPARLAPYEAPRMILTQVGPETGFAASASVGASTEGFNVSEETWTW